jgi:hypothetical protein
MSYAYSSQVSKQDQNGQIFLIRVATRKTLIGVNLTAAHRSGATPLLKDVVLLEVPCHNFAHAGGVVL